MTSSTVSTPWPPLQTNVRCRSSLRKDHAARNTLVIPPRRNRKVQRAYDAELYKEHNRIERFFNKLKQFRRVATRYDKLLANFMGFVKIAAIAIWLK